MKSLSSSEIKEIAEQMDCGMRCYHNIKTNKLVFFPADLEFDDDYAAEFFQDDINELQNNADDYHEIEKPESRDSFQIMEDFANSAQIDERFRVKLQTVLELKKPFANFKTCIDNSDYREDWFSFKSNWMQKWVKDQIELDEE
jgi:hypothetical protein